MHLTAMSGSYKICGCRGVNDPVLPQVVVLVVDSECRLLRVDSAVVCILRVISENARSTTLSLSADSMNNILLILTKGWGNGVEF